MSQELTESMAQMPTGAKGVAVAVDPVALVVTECITVTSAMRKHARWAHSSVSAILGGGAGTMLSKKGAPISPRFPVNKDKAPSAAPTGTDPSTEDIGLASRWGLRGKKGQSMQDNPLLSAFARLRSNLKNCKDIHTVDAPSILHPFLQVIRSSSTSAPITSLALIAITKFFAYNIISRDSPQLPLAMQLLSSAVTHCRFEASDPAADEVVLFRILKLMEGMITGPGGEVLGDESMCQMMECGISMCCQSRLSELLRRSAEVSMVTMCQTIFRRLRYIEVEVENVKVIRRDSIRADDAIKMEPSVNGGNSTTSISSAIENTNEGRSSQSLDISREKDGVPESVDVNGSSSVILATPEEGAEPADIKPYSLPSIRELFRVLVDILDPHDRQHTDTMRVMALRIVDVGLEVAGPWIASHPTLAVFAKDTLCRHLFQLVRSENIAILNESLRVAGTMLSTCRRVLKLQQELFLSYLVACLHPRVEIPQEPSIDPALYEGVPQSPRLVKPAPSQNSSGRSTPVPVKDRQRLGMEGGLRKPDAREAMVESVGALVRISSFMAELFVNYDCEIDRSDLCVDMVGLLSRNAFPDAATWSTTNVPPLCLDALLGYVQSVADRLEDESVLDGFPTIEVLLRQRSRKKVIVKGTVKFNENPKAGIAFLASQGIIDDAENPHSITSFMRGTSRIDKKVLGDFLTKRNNEKLLSAFMDTFDFSDLRVDQALRQLLNSFRLPGEAPLIAKIVNEFSSKYCSTSTLENIPDKDAIYVLTYAIIMLNTDQHNPNVKSQNRMTLADFSKNLRGVNSGKDFDSEYLQEIYDSIKSQEIILPEEHDNKHAFDHAWKDLLLKIQSSSDLLICNTNMFDGAMFAATWKPVVATLTYVFMSATDDTVFSRVVTGFDQCAQIAAKYHLHDALDHIIFCLSSISTLASEKLPNTSLNTEVQAGEKNIMVSETAVRFGRDFKAQLATVVLFGVVTGHEAAIRDGWLHLTRIMLSLFINSLISTSYSSLSSNTELPVIPVQSPAQTVDRSERSNETGFFSVVTSYVSSFANDEPPEPSDQEIEFTLCTVECISSCSFEQIFSNISQMPADSIHSFVTTLLGHLPEDSSPRVIVVKPELPAPTPVRPNGPKTRPVGVAYEPSVVFILEFATILAARDAETIAKSGKEVANALQSVIRDSAHMHPVTISRAVYYLLSFLRASHDHDYISTPVVLHSISKFDEELLKQAAPLVVKGLALCLGGPAGLRNQMTTSPDFWSVLRSLYLIPEAAAIVFKIVENIATGAPTAVTADNYVPAISLLNDFATASGQAAVDEQRRDHAARRGAKQANQKQNQKGSPKPSEASLQGAKSTTLIYQLSTRAPFFIEQSQLEPQEAWRTYWMPPFRALVTQSLNACRPIRSQAIISLQRCLLSPALGIVSEKVEPPIQAPPPQGKAWTSIFPEVLFPLTNQLLKPESFHLDPTGMPETRVSAAVLVCKVFLRYMDALAEADVLVTLWDNILKLMDRLMNAGQGGESMEEAVPESLKNIILVMATSGYLVPPPASVGARNAQQTPLQKKLWEISWKRLERFLPNLMREVFAEAVPGTSPTKSKSPKTPRPPADGPQAAENVPESDEKKAPLDAPEE